MILLLLACDPVDLADTASEPQADPTDPDATLASTELATDMTWTLSFDDEAEATGFVDCTYSRTYTGSQLVDQPWLCPECTAMYEGTASMYTGYDDCYVQISSSEAERSEYWGFSWPTDGSDGAVFRSGGLPNWSLGELADVAQVATGETIELAWGSDNELTDGGTMRLDATGTAVVTESDDLLVDYQTPRVDPYACGWPTDNPGTLSTDYLLDDGAVIPNARLEDTCGEMVDLWDFYGRYMIVDVAQPDCGPCKNMAEDAPAGIAAIRAAGNPIIGVTILGGGLNTPYLEPEADTVTSWLSAYGDEELLLKDRGWGYAIFEPYWGDEFGYPTFAIVAPDMTVIEVWKGYGGTTWDDIAALIADHAG